jgi:hypothetical protein
MVKMVKHAEKVYRTFGNPVYVAVVENGVVTHENAYDPTGAVLVWNTSDGRFHDHAGEPEGGLRQDGYHYSCTVVYYLTEDGRRYERGEGGVYLPMDNYYGEEYTSDAVEVIG